MNEIAEQPKLLQRLLDDEAIPYRADRPREFGTLSRAMCDRSRVARPTTRPLRPVHSRRADRGSPWGWRPPYAHHDKLPADAALRRRRW